MARHLNTNCDFNSGFLMSDIPKWGKHTLTEDCERRTERYRLWEKHTQCVMIDPTKRVELILLQKVHDSGSSSDSAAWVQVAGDLEFTHKIFNDPKTQVLIK